MSPRQRVVITGLGAVSAAGRGVEPFWRACVEGRSMLRQITRFDTSDYGTPAAGEIPQQDYENLMRANGRTEVAAACVLEAAAEALRQAGFHNAVPPRSGGVALGTCLGGAEAACGRLEGSLFAPAVRLATRYGLAGPVVTVSVACASGTAAICLAADAIRRGESDVMLTGGVDVLSLFVVSGFWSLRALASGCVRPFDRRRDGLALGEGAAVVVLEGLAHAVKRGAFPLAEVLGGGTSGDANHMTGPSPAGDGVVRAIEAALRDARLDRGTVEFISAHGTGTPFNDRMETIAIKRVFGPLAPRIPVSSIKPIVGHTLGAAGALEAVLCVRLMQEGMLPPTINYGEPDPECDLDYIPNSVRRMSVRCALSCSSAFAGNNAALLLGAP